MKPRILIVDDYPETLATLRELFESQGYSVSTAESSERALATLDEHWPDLVIIDDDPSGTSGVALIASIKTVAFGRGLKSLPAIAMRNDYLVRAEPVLIGFDYVVSKPLDFERFEGLIRRCICTGQELGTMYRVGAPDIVNVNRSTL